jgi:hypothetical protein
LPQIFAVSDMASRGGSVSAAAGGHEIFPRLRNF